MLFVIRTAGRPWRNRPSLPLSVTTLAIVVIGGVLTQSRTAETFGFVRMPSTYFVFLAAVVGTYLLIVEIVKRRVIQRLMPGHVS